MSENHRLLYLVGAARTKGCAMPIRICPNMTTPKWPPVARVPAYLTKLPTSNSKLATKIDVFGPPLFKVHMTSGDAATKANRKPVLNQLIALSLTPKYSADVVDTAAKVSQSQLTTRLSRESWASPRKRLRYTCEGGVAG